VSEFLKWDGTGEPQGWTRHVCSSQKFEEQGGYRRRPDGDPAKEYIAP
jgi:hypothetical protein